MERTISNSKLLEGEDRWASLEIARSGKGVTGAEEPGRGASRETSKVQARGGPKEPHTMAFHGSQFLINPIAPLPTLTTP